MNTSSRVPGITRNSGWQAIDAEIAARRVLQQQNRTTSLKAVQIERIVPIRSRESISR